MIFKTFFIHIVLIQDVSEVKAKRIEALSKSLSMVAAVYEFAKTSRRQKNICFSILVAKHVQLGRFLSTETSNVDP